jgi:hypothetical protein
MIANVHRHAISSLRALINPLSLLPRHGRRWQTLLLRRHWRWISGMRRPLPTAVDQLEKAMEAGDLSQTQGLFF